MARQYSKVARWQGILRLSRRQLQQRWLESLFIILGLALGVGVFTGMETFVRFFASIEQTANQAVPELHGVTVQPRQLDYNMWNEGVPAVPVSDDMISSVQLTMADVLDVKDHVAGIGYIHLPTTVWGGNVLAIDGGDPSPEQSQGRVELHFISPDTISFTGQETLAGTMFNWPDVIDKRSHLAIEEEMAEALFPGMAWDDIVGRTVTLRTGGESTVWTIVAVVAPDPVELMYMPPEFRQDRWKGYAPARMQETLREITVIPADKSKEEAMVRELTAYFDQRYGSGQVEVRGRFDTGSVGAIVALLVLSGLALLIAAVNILNLFIARVWRRQRITGVSVALGATRSMLFWQTAGEALLLGIAGSLLGLAVATGVIGLLKMFYMSMLVGMEGWNPFESLRLTAVDMGIGMLLGTSVSVVFGLYPALLAAKQQPAEALRNE